MTTPDPPSLILLTWLRSELLVQTASSLTWPGGYGSEDTPGTGPTANDSVTVYDTEGTIHGRDARNGFVEFHGVQIRIRCASYARGWDKGVDIQAALENLRNAEVTVGANSYTIHAFTLTAPLTRFGRLEQNLAELFSVNGLLSIS
jgi:hypothetical protein